MRFTIRGIKNRMAKFLSLMLSMCILCGLLFSSAPASFASNGEELVDIKAHWAETVIKEWVAQGLIKGYGNGRFGPNDSISRAEFVTLLNRIFCYTQKSNVSFPDVKKDAWYAGEIAKAYQSGIIKGDSNGSIKPEAVISRQEAAVMLTRAFSLTKEYAGDALTYTGSGASLNGTNSGASPLNVTAVAAPTGTNSGASLNSTGFGISSMNESSGTSPANENISAALKYADHKQIADWALDSVGVMTKKGYISGRPGNLFAPKDDLSRSEAVKMIDNVMGELINSSGTYTKTVPGNMVVSSKDVTLKDTNIDGDLYLTDGIGQDTIRLIGVTVKGRTIISGTLSDKVIVLSGDFGEIIVESPGSVVTLESGTVDRFVVGKTAAGAVITAKDGTVIENLITYAGADITGGSNIKNAVIASGGVTMDEKPQNVIIADGGKAVSYKPGPGNIGDSGGGGPSGGGDPGGGDSGGGDSGGGDDGDDDDPGDGDDDDPEPDTTAPSIPTGLTGTAVSSSVVSLSWTASTDNVGVTGYHIYRDDTEIGTSTTTSYTDTGLAADTTYSYTISAYDAAANTSNKSSSVSTTTLIDSGIIYYIDFESGDDANQGTSPDSAWKHCPGDVNAGGVAAAATLCPGDTVMFRGGVIYRGTISTKSDGVTYRGDAWPAGVKAIIDGSDPFLNDKIPCTMDECGTNPNWSNIVYVDLPDTIETYNDFMMFDESTKLWPAQCPKVPDSFWEDDFSSYRPVSPENITVNSIKDPDYFNQTDPDYWDGAYIMIWINPNVVTTQPVTGYDPATGTIYYKELSENAIYGNRDQYFSMTNHIDLITQPGEYYVDEANHKMYLWPRDDSELSIATRSVGFHIVGQSDLIFEGFVFQKLVGQSAIITWGAWVGSGLRSNNLTIRNNEMKWIKKTGSIHTGAITLRRGTGHIIENNYIHDIQRGSGIIASGEVSDTIIRNNVITRCGYKGIWLLSDENIQIIDNRFFDNKATHGTDVSVFTSKNILFADNIAFNSRSEMFSFENDENIFIYNNILLSDGSGPGAIRQNGDNMKGILFIAHNTVLYSGNGSGLNCMPSRYPNARYIVKNNILDGWGCGVNDGSGMRNKAIEYEVSNNIYTDLAWVQDERYGWYLMPYEIVEDNLDLIFRDPVEEVTPVIVPVEDIFERYKLKGGSPAIGTGESLNNVIPREALELFPNYDFYKDFEGNTRQGDKSGDIGAYQYSEN